jgi:hypothetical protein
MKKIYLLLTLLVCSLVQAQGSEDFTNSNATATYAASSFVGNGGITWTYSQSRDEGVYPIATKGLMLRRASDSYLEATITGGIGNLQFDYRKAFTGTAARQLEVLINGVQVTTSPIFGTVTGEETAVYNLNYNVNQPGTVVLRIKNVGTATTNVQATIDNIVWTGFAGAATPSIAISSPANSTIFNPETTNVNVALSVLNFNVANGTGDGHIRYTINGGAGVMQYDTTPIAVPTTPGAYTVYVELVDNSNVAIVPAKNATVTFTVASYTSATTLAAVRAAGINAWVNYTGTSVVSFSRPLVGGRNQKYIQDATAGILVDDNAGLITTPFVIGDGISNIKGQLINFNGVMEFVPNQDATKPSTGNTITPQVVSLATIAGNIDAYESQLVQINGLTFTDADGTLTFVANTETPINDGTISIFRPMFPATEVDYIGAVIPTGARNIAVIVSENTGVLKVVARSLAELTLSRNSFDAISGLKIYPNPAKNVLNISSDSFEAKTVAIYNVLGAQVLSANVTNAPINVASLSRGIYVVKVTEEGKTATRKLVIE